MVELYAIKILDLKYIVVDKLHTSSGPLRRRAQLGAIGHIGMKYARIL